MEVEWFVLLHVSQMCWEGTQSFWGFLLHPTALSLLEAEIPILVFINLPRCFFSSHSKLVQVVPGESWWTLTFPIEQDPFLEQVRVLVWVPHLHSPGTVSLLIKELWSAVPVLLYPSLSAEVCPLWWTSFNKRFVKRNYYKLALWFWTWNRYRPYRK